METLAQKVERLQSEMDALSAQSPRNETAINQTLAALAEAKEKLENEQAALVMIQQIQQDHEDRVTKTTDDFNYKIENLIIGNGMRLRDVMVDESFWLSSSISIKGMFQAEVDNLSRQIAVLQTENAEVTALRQKDNAQLQEMTNKYNQEVLEHTFTKQSRDNAASLLKESNEKNEQLEEQLKTAAAGVKTTNTEEEQQKKAENDARIKLERTIYNVTPDNPLNPRLYSAFKAATGEQLTFPQYAIKSYIVIQESEVSQFRADNGIAETTAPDTDNTPVEQAPEDVQDSVTPEVPFPDIPKAELPTAPDTVDQGQHGGETPTEENGTVTRAEFEALVNRVVELEKVCNINEDADSQAVA